jgi:CRISPR type III-A-associated RAMP protein Csm5
MGLCGYLCFHAGAEHDLQKELAEKFAQSRIPSSKKAGIAEADILECLNRNETGIDISSDPFRGIKISDAILPEDSTEIVQVLNVHLKGASGKGIPMWVEVVKSDTVFEFDLSLLPKEQMRSVKTKPFSKTEIVQASHDYFADAFNEEDELSWRKVMWKQGEKLRDSILNNKPYTPFSWKETESLEKEGDEENEIHNLL